MWLEIEKNEKLKRIENVNFKIKNEYKEINNQIKTEVYLPDWLVEKKMKNEKI